MKLKAQADDFKSTKIRNHLLGRIKNEFGSGDGYTNAAFKDLSGRENIRLSAGFLGLENKVIEERMEAIIEFADLAESIDKPLRTFSSGMRSRLGFSIACNVEPDILLLDEVFTVGDHRFRTKSKERIKELIEGDCTVIMVSHSLPMVEAMCDRAIVMDNGKVVFDGQPGEAIKKHKEGSV